ncbi:acetylhydrolase [Belnapia sp. T18]|uniref:Acetylhydrolase n=1 Tax=Belnapia arida TaxID=2804533 RepID=A0ABS1U2W9_9PROT|nr:acetylhydrolase [Belnapia arida]MBL6079007.1 acetylhydrolase [Belnapia arida]
MQRRRLLALAGLATIPAPLAAAPVPMICEDWTDPARNRRLPALIRLPDAEAPAPAVLVSHGLGGSREGLAYLGQALAEAGFLVLHIQHPGTDAGIWQGRTDISATMAAAALDTGQAFARLQDGIFALGELTRRPGLRERVDASRLAIAGHSYGAWLVQHMLGQRLPGGDHGLALPDARLKAGIALSPIPPRGLSPRFAFGRIARPMLHVTGTLDSGYIDGATAEDRELPFHSISGPPQALAVLAGATHAAFADERAAGPRWADPAFHARTAGLAVAFLRATLLGDAAARAALFAGMSGLLVPGDRLTCKDFG